MNPNHLVKLIEDATNRLESRVVRTPMVSLHWMSNPSWRVYAKLECHQHTGSFKFWGALNATELTKAQSVVTASAGNHALGIC